MSGKPAACEENVTSADSSNPEFLTIEEVAAVLRVCCLTVRSLIHTANLPAKRIGRQFRVPASQFKKWLAQR